jgi:thymidylate synthase ThyX
VTTSARILADSVNPMGVRLTTILVTFPRFLLAEINTHRMLSRNSASSRAIPVAKMIRAVEEHPFEPEEWYRNTAGMASREPLADHDREAAVLRWRAARDAAIEQARALDALKVHKSIINRILEPYMWHTALITATEWQNFFHLRTAADAQPEFRALALLIQEEYERGTPRRVEAGDWHIPAFGAVDEGTPPETLLKVATARAARVSYTTHDQARAVEEDIRLHDRLADSGHWSPFEHCAQARDDREFDRSNLRGWTQYRKRFANENVEG